MIQGPGENAGVIDIGDGLAVVFKMESHNHPSYHRALSGRGDRASAASCATSSPWARGRSPASIRSRFGDPDHPKTRHLVAGVVAGIGGYGNSFGVPTVGGSVRFHTRYDGNILVNAMAVGLAENGRDLLRRPRRASASRSSISAPRPAATASTARPWRRPSSTTTPRKSARPCRSAIPSPRSCCSKPASRSWPRAASSRSRTWARPA